MRAVGPVVTLLLALAVAGSVASAGSATRASVQPAPSEPPVVPSLDPGRTAELWSRLVSRPRALRQAQPADCRPLRAVFYAATDWLRLATKLAEQASPCAEYYVGVPAIVGNRTRLRPNAASRIRALGPNFHAMGEIHFSAWSTWVQETGSSWHAAGVTARQRMAEAGYDVALGDTWQLNELSTAVRRGAGSARANIREFLRGLYEGDGSRPTPGAALIVGVGQRTCDLSVYQNTLQEWLTDEAFWADMARYVSDWTQEAYGDVRAHAVPGVPTSVRREFLSDYLQHKHVLAGVAPESLEPARAYLRGAYASLGNAAWQRDTGYGWTMVSAQQMGAYVSAQVNAMRHYSATTGQPRDHWGFAWAPRNATGMSSAEFAAQTDHILERLAAAIRDSGDVVEPANPGSGACGPPGQDTLCLVDLSEARHNEAWRSFRGWTLAALGFATEEQTVAAGSPSAPIGVGLFTSTGLRITSGPPRLVTLRSSSPQGAFSTTPAGPWTPTLDVTAAVGADAVVHYRDTLAGRHTVTASAAGTTSRAQTVTVTAGPATRMVVTPPSGAVRARGARLLRTAVTDVYGNTAPATAVTWRVTPAALGTIEPGENGRATFTAGRLLRSGTVTATSGSVSASASVTVTPARLRVAPVVFRPGKRGVRVLLSTVDGTRRPVSAARITYVVRLEGRRLSSGRVRT
ncbi:MAG TPA: hypothetical protein VK896_10110, partial [Gaiellaceae bacterium]|nr:hypothetical protein [Gaiellaceae bacterium]